MFLVSITAEYNYKIKNIIDSKLLTYFNEDDLKNNDYSKFDYIITEYNKKIIDYFLSLNKKVIVIDNSFITNNKRIIVINNKKELKKISNSIKKEVNKKKRITTILFLILMLFLIPLLLIQIKPKEEVIEERYLFLGDSITEFYKLNNYYGDKIVFNSGISGDRTYNILENLNKRVFRYKPTTVFLLIGTNDLLDYNNKVIISNIYKICDNIYSKNDKIKIYVESIYPISAEDNNKISKDMVNTRDNNRIKEINNSLSKSSKKHHYTYIDLYSVLVDYNDNIKLDYTTDGLHLSDEGYKVVTREIKKYMK